jgi:uncharacterized protein YebE (UPF0316 family)
MKHSELKQIIREEIYRIIDETDPSIQNVMREKEYEVEYWYRFGKYGDDEDNEVIKVKAPSEKEAIEKAKKEARKNAIASSFKVKK